MTEKEKLIFDAETLVRTVLTKHFSQKIEGESLRSAAEKVAEGIPRRTADHQRSAA